MAAPQGYAQPNAYTSPQYNENPQQPGFTNTTSPPPSASDHVDGGKKKKRGYAAQAYEFGAGGNSALGGAFQPPQTPVYGGYPAQSELQAGYGASGAHAAQAGPQVPLQASYGQPPTSGGPVGYQPPEVGYQSPGVISPGVGTITQGMSQMGLGGAPQAAVQPQQAVARPVALNHLYPTDLLNQPFNVAELELPPPPIILPPNVSALSFIISRDTNCLKVQRNSVTRCQLPSQACSFHIERCSYDSLLTQKIKIAICTCYTTVHLST
jgi:protein transport protein SEC24